MDINVMLDKLSPYTPGDTVTGKVLFVKSSVTPILLAKPTGLKIQFKGKSSVKFTVMDNFNYKGRWRTHASSESYFNSSKYLIGNGTFEVPELFGTGLQEFPFSYTLPPNIPSSYKGTHGSVEYSITITLKRSWGVNKELTHVFQVNGDLDIGSFIQTRQLSTIRKSEKVGMLWWGGTVFVNFNLRKKFYIPGEFLQFSAQIINDSKSKIHKAKLLLTQECRFYAQGGSHTVTHIIKKVKGPGVHPGESAVTWENNSLLKIPPLPPTNLGGLCRIIEINYFVHLLVQPYSISFKDNTVVCKLPITLGTKRGPGNRNSFPGFASATGSLLSGITGISGMGNRVANIFGGSCATSPRGTLNRFAPSAPTSSISGEMSYYQNVVFPLARCFSAPLYENFRFPRSSLASPINFNEGFLEEQENQDEDKYEPPPTYDEAMSFSRLSMHNDDAHNDPEVYQNSIMSPTPPNNGIQAPARPACASQIVEQPFYNNS